MTVAVRPEILTSLGTIRQDIERHLSGMERYRALLAVEKTIAEFRELDDLSGSLAEIRDRIKEQLGGTREYRALCAIEKITPELAEVVAFLDERANASSPGKEFAADVQTEVSQSENRNEPASAPDSPQASTPIVQENIVAVAAETKHLCCTKPDRNRRYTADPDLGCN